MSGWAGIRTSDENVGKTAVDSQSGAESGALDADLSLIDADLQAIIDVWPRLSEDVKASILATVLATAEQNE